MKNKLFFFIVIIVAVGFFGFFINKQQIKTPQELVIYSGRSEPLILPIIQSFEQKTGKKVTLKSGSSLELATLLLEEKENTNADVYIGTDAGWLEKLGKNGLFTPIATGNLTQIPAEYRASDSTWTGVSGRARVLIVNTDLVAEADRPTSIYDITDPQWKGKVAMAKISNESVVTHLSGMRILHGDEFLKSFLAGLKKNEVKILNGHTDVRRAVAAGEFSIGFVNHYYGHLQQRESDNIAIVYTDQKDGQDGSMVNVAGIGIIKYGKNTPAAQEFVEYLLSEKAQKQFAELNFEFPLVSGVKSSNTKNMGEFKQMDIDLYEAADALDGTIAIIKESGL